MTADYLRPYSLVDRALIVRAAEHFAADYYGSAFGLELADAARSVTVAHLRRVTAVHGRAAVTATVAAYLADHPEALARTDRDRERYTYTRDSEWTRLIAAAGQAYQAGKLDRALCLVDDAAAVQPCRSVAAYHHRIIKAAKAAGGAR